MLYRKIPAFLKSVLCGAAFASVLFHGQLSAHCQMPCGIYHDDMVYDLIDQYVETMYKGISVLNKNTFTTPKEKNEFIRWVMEKDKSSDQTAKLITEYFLQQKIKSGEDDTVKRLVSAHNLLTLCMTIKQNVDLQLIKDFSKEWDKFKLMFHREDYECEIDKLKIQARAKQKAAAEKAELAHTHDHDHDHDHDQVADHDHKHPH